MDIIARDVGYTCQRVICFAEKATASVKHLIYLVIPIAHLEPAPVNTGPFHRSSLN